MSYKTGRKENTLQAYLKEHSSKLHPAQEALIKKTLEHDRNEMLGARDELQLLSTIVKYMGAKKTIDIGVYTGYSALSIALVLPQDGKVVACDVSQEFADIGKPFWKEAGVDHKIDLRIAPAVDTLNYLISSGEAGTFDFVFIDCDKLSYDRCYELSLTLTRPGGLIAVDNALYDKEVLNPDVTDENAKAIHKLNTKIKDDKRVDAVLLEIGDGTMLAWKKL